MRRVVIFLFLLLGAVFSIKPMSSDPNVKKLMKSVEPEYKKKVKIYIYKDIDSIPAGFKSWERDIIDTTLWKYYGRLKIKEFENWFKEKHDLRYVKAFVVWRFEQQIHTYRVLQLWPFDHILIAYIK
ncbi:hypothetical protein GF385_03205 [Candidatus Dependentiae bacterium]|nr:hypothetical protein [Candidatus Dependentiae bacterium]